MTSLVTVIKGRACQDRQTKEDPDKCHKKLILIFTVQEQGSNHNAKKMLLLIKIKQKSGHITMGRVGTIKW